jgi:hypothetical protein
MIAYLRGPTMIRVRHNAVLESAPAWATVPGCFVRPTGGQGERKAKNGAQNPAAGHRGIHKRSPDVDENKGPASENEPKTNR